MKKSTTCLTYTLIFLIFTGQAISQGMAYVQKLLAVSAQKSKTLIGILIIILSYQFSFSQDDFQGFVLSGIAPETIEVNQTFTTTSEIYPFDKNVSTIFGLALTADIVFQNEKSMVRVILIDKNYEEYLVYEVYPLLEANSSFSVDNICEETSILNSVKPHSVRIEITDAKITINSFTYASGLKSGTDVQKVKKEKKQVQNEVKINKINKNLEAKKLSWIAGPTSVSEMTYAERKKLYGQGTFPPGFEYYSGGVIQAGNSTKSEAAASPYVDEWDWRNRHGQNWITSIKNQGSCGSCWAFAATGATEAMVNLYFNQHLNLNLSEQDVLSCSGAGSCSGGWPGIALDYISKTGVVDEETFPYTATDQPCENKGTNPSELIKIDGRIDFGSTAYPRTEDDLKRMIIEKGPLSGGLSDWSHAMVLPGYMVVEEGDYFYYRNTSGDRYWKTVGAGDPLIGKTVWIFKNSWGSWFGDNGYVYVETDITNFNWTHALLPPVQSLVQTYEVQCVDNDGDGYYWWGLGEKPAGCDCPDQPDGDDSDPSLGPLDEYGYCTPIVTPVAAFSGNPTSVMEGQAVTFTDQSDNKPTSWSWSFPGGTPSTSEQQNPVVTYSAIGTYDVSLTATNSAGSDTHTKTGYINVTEFVYCTSSGTSVSSEWVETVNFGSFTNTSGSNGGYGDFTSSTISVESGQTYNLNLTPGFSDRSRREYWRVWIDYNMDGDFTDSGEEVFAADGKKNTVSGSISIPAGLTGETRMRVSMKYNKTPTPCEQFSDGEVEDYTLFFSTPVPQPPVADFSGTPTTVSVGNSVQFSDLSLNNPTSWSWTFTGGTPATSTAQNPSVTYDTEGSYSVTLTAVNDEGSDAITKFNYITVTEAGAYCSSQSNSNDLEWISRVIVGGLDNSSGASYYSDFTSISTDLAPGSSYDVALTPYFTGSSQREFWRIWIDFNQDGDFDDADETVFIANNKKSAVTGIINIPTYFSGTTRMRVSMKYGSSPSSCESFDRGEVEDYTVNISGGTEFTRKVLINKKTSGLFSDELKLDLYPNPAKDLLNIEMELLQKQDINIRLADMLGNEIINIDNKEVDHINWQIDMQSLVPGVYVLEVKFGNETVHRKVIKE